MAELYPSDADLTARSGSPDSRQEVLFPAIGESPYYLSFYKMLARLLDVADLAGQLRVYKDGALTFGVRPGGFANGASAVGFAGATTQALTDNSANSIYLLADGTLHVSASGFPDPSLQPHVPLAVITTASGSYGHNDITDCRQRSAFAPLSGMSAAQAAELVSGETTSLHRHDQAGLEDAAVTAAKLGYAPDAIVLVQHGLTDEENGLSLLAAYAAAKQLQPGGQELAAFNRACVLLPPGAYALPVQTGAPAMMLDGECVDLVGMTPFDQDATVVTSAGGSGKGETICQSAGDVRLSNFSIRNDGAATGNHAFTINADPSAGGNSASQYRLMRFTVQSSGPSQCAVYALSNLAGTWESCRSGNYGWRLGPDVTLTASMTECVGGNCSFTSDQGGALLLGSFARCTAGGSSFGGGVTSGCECSSNFTDCVAGDNSFGLGATFSGSAKRCAGGFNCFGGYVGSGTNYGLFVGYAEDCTASGNSFGGGHASAACAGRLVRCRNLSMSNPMYLTMAILSGCEFKVTAANQHCLVLNDSNSRLYNCTIVTASGSGKSVYADAKDIVAAHCRANTAFALNGGSDVLGAGGFNVIHSAITL